MSAVLEKQGLMNRESPVAGKIPYKAHLDPYTVKTYGDDFIQVIRLGGAAHESADIRNINRWHRSLNETLRNIAGPDVAIWTHLVRTHDHARLEGRYPEGFARDFNDKYMKSVAGKAMLVNEIYVTVVHQARQRQFGVLARILGTGMTREQREEFNGAGLARVEEVTTQLVDMLDPYDPVRLSTYRRPVALIAELLQETVELECSEVLEFLGFLTNGTWERVALPRAPLDEALPVSRPFFGNETFELRGAAESVFGAVLAVKEYPSQTEPGSLNCLMTMPFPLVVAQSFAFMDKEKALKLIDRQIEYLEAVGDAAKTELEQLDGKGGAKDQVASGMIVYGHHHLGVFVYSDAVPGADQAAHARAVQQVNARLSQARAALVDVGAKIAREDAANEAQFYAALPGNFRYRPRLSPISSKNFAGLSSFHNYPTGRPAGNDWGEALTVFRTTSNTLYYFNLHKGKKGLREQRRTAIARAVSSAAPGLAARADGDEGFSLAHTKIFGPPGTGKTVVEAMIYVQALKFDPTGFIFDKDCGLKLMVLALGGRYLELKRGLPSGLNPMQLEPTERNVAFLNEWVQQLVTGNGEALAPKDYKDIDRAIRAVMHERIPKKDRRLTRLLELLDKKDPNGVRARLERWCQGGTDGWVFDCEADELDLTAARHFGFDMTEFLDIDAVRDPLMMYLFYRMNELIDGRRMIVVIAEFWKALQARYFENKLEDWLVTARKLNAAVVMDTQLIAHAMRSKAAAAIQNATATSIYMPNADADWKDYGEGMKLTRREFHIVKDELGENSRRFLVKQGAASVVCELNLKGFEDELAVLSTTGKTRTLVDRVREQHGTDPAAWLPMFQQARRAA